MLARIQQALMLALLLAAALWGAAFWPERPGWALAGALAILFGFAAVLALEFALQAAVSAKDPVPRAGAARLLKAWWQEAGIFVQVFFWRQPFLADAVPDFLPDVTARPAGARRGVVFIHGLGCNRGFWTPWLRQLRATQRPFIAVNLEPPGGDIDRHVPTVEDAVQRLIAATGLAPVLVCHSMGGLVARAWLRDQEGGPPRVHKVVTIATPHQGTWLAHLSRAAHGVQMRLGSDWLGRFGKEAAGPPFPSLPPFVCWYSNADNMVFPPTTATLPGADNRLVPGVAHVALAFEPRVLRETLALL